MVDAGCPQTGEMDKALVLQSQVRVLLLMIQNLLLRPHSLTIAVPLLRPFLSHNSVFVESSESNLFGGIDAFLADVGKLISVPFLP